MTRPAEMRRAIGKRHVRIHTVCPVDTYPYPSLLSSTFSSTRQLRSWNEESLIGSPGASTCTGSKYPSIPASVVRFSLSLSFGAACLGSRHVLYLPGAAIWLIPLSRPGEHVASGTMLQGLFSRSSPPWRQHKAMHQEEGLKDLDPARFYTGRPRFCNAAPRGPRPFVPLSNSLYINVPLTRHGSHQLRGVHQLSSKPAASAASPPALCITLVRVESLWCRRTEAVVGRA
ncbi:hypothetical protein B0J13DRAFT_285171 [Dactylonectria estremocensis]|uniref:Uncharacterized protein n=1 Tax=Dactylonectria estremocensis TaxID=1079267 RepID=A0A9P9F246_9HYPO|nr:hypothetical protein B0J13DRAFT_285171 [Dactylonectria estremocensis]